MNKRQLYKKTYKEKFKPLLKQMDIDRAPKLHMQLYTSCCFCIDAKDTATKKHQRFSMTVDGRFCCVYCKADKDLCGSIHSKMSKNVNLVEKDEICDFIKIMAKEVKKRSRLVSFGTRRRI